MLRLRERDWRSAEQLLKKSLLIIREVGDKYNVAECLESIGKLKVDQGEWLQAESLFLEAMDIANNLGSKLRIASLKQSLGLLAEMRNDLISADNLFREALIIFEKANPSRTKDIRQDLARIMENIR